MRTTLTLDPDVESLLRKAIYEEGKTFKQAVNDAVRAGLVKPAQKARPFVQETYVMGRPRVDLSKALAVAAQLEDQEAVARLARARPRFGPASVRPACR